jgi:hypothetical protein
MVSTCCYQSWMFDYNVCMKVFLLCLQWLSTSILSSSSYSSCSKGFSTTWSHVVSIRTECLLTISAWNSSFYVCKGCWHQCFHHLSTIHVLNFFNNMVSTCCYQNWMFAYNVCMKIFLFCLLLIPIHSSSSYSSCSKCFLIAIASFISSYDMQWRPVDSNFIIMSLKDMFWRLFQQQFYHSSCYSSCSKGFLRTWSQLVAIRTTLFVCLKILSPK